MIFDENGMNISASDDVDPYLLEKLYLTPEEIEQLKSILFNSLITHLCTLLVKNDLSEPAHTDALKKVQNVFKTSEIMNLQLFCVWRHTPSVAVGIFSRVADTLGYNAQEFFAFSEENVLQATVLGNAFVERCPWAREEAFQF